MSVTYTDDQQNDPGGIRWSGGLTLPREWFHDEWLRRESDWRMFRLCYLGGRDFLGSKKPLTLFSHARENQRSYADRLKRAFYRNFCESIVGLKADAIYQPQVLRNQGGGKDGEEKPPQSVVKRAQVADATFEGWLRDVDGKGTNADPWWNETARWAMSFGLEWAEVAMMPAPELQARARSEGRVISRYEAEEAGIRPYLCRSEPLSVINWGCDHRGRTTFVSVMSTEQTRVPFASKTDKTGKPRPILRVLWPTYEERFAVGANGVRARIAEVPHPFGEVPMIQVTVRADGRSQLEDIARLNIEVYNLDSQITEQSSRQTFNQWVAKVKERDEFMQNVKGTDSVFAIGVDEDLSILAPDTNTIKALEERADKLTDDMYAMANLRSRPGAKGSQPAADTSGVAYAFEHKQAETDLASIATRLEEAELKVGRMRARALGLTPDGFTAQYPREFDIRALLSRASEAQQLKLAGLGPKAMAEVLKNLVRKALPRLPAGKLDQIDAEIDTVAAQPQPAIGLDGRATNTPPDQSMQAPGKGAGEDRSARAAKPIAPGDRVKFRAKGAA